MGRPVNEFVALTKAVPLGRTTSDPGRLVKRFSVPWIAATLLFGGISEADAQGNQSNSAGSNAAALERLFRCVDIPDDTLRVQCYDALVRPLADARVDSEFQNEITLYAFSGRDDHDTETLTIEHPWRARWVFEGSILTIELRQPNGELVNIVGNQIGAGHGNTELLDPGTYQLAIRGLGKWQIAVEPD